MFSSIQIISQNDNRLTLDLNYNQNKISSSSRTLSDSIEIDPINNLFCFPSDNKFSKQKNDLIKKYNSLNDILADCHLDWVGCTPEKAEELEKVLPFFIGQLTNGRVGSLELMNVLFDKYFNDFKNKGHLKNLTCEIKNYLKKHISLFDLPRKLTILLNLLLFAYPRYYLNHQDKAGEFFFICLYLSVKNQIKKSINEFESIYKKGSSIQELQRPKKTDFIYDIISKSNLYSKSENSHDFDIESFDIIYTDLKNILNDGVIIDENLSKNHRYIYQITRDEDLNYIITSSDGTNTFNSDQKQPKILLTINSINNLSMLGSYKERKNELYIPANFTKHVLSFRVLKTFFNLNEDSKIETFHEVKVNSLFLNQFLNETESSSSSLPSVYEKLLFIDSDGNKYEGEFKDNKFNGKGTYILSNGHKYEGEFENNKFNGKGTLNYSNGNKYEGEFKDNKRHGKGSFIFSHGDKYEGEFKDNTRHGKGIYIFSTGEKYEGEFKDNKTHGKGIYIFSNGEKYEGEFKDNKFDGKGILNFSNGDKYEGEFKDGKFNGKGIFIDPDGNKYEGEFKDDKFNGKGILNLSNGDKYEGKFKDGKFDGKGIYTYYNGDKYEGEFKNDKKHGKGTSATKKGFFYTGNWKDSKKHGKGTFIDPDGDKYEGNWINGKMSGQFILTQKNRLPRIIFYP